MTSFENVTRPGTEEEALGALVRSGVPDGLPPAHPAERDRFLEGFSRLPGAHANRRLPVRRLALGAAIAAAAAGIALWLVDGSAPIGYSVGPGNRGTGEYIRAGEAPVEVVFSDGSGATLAAGARGHIGPLTDRGAAISVDWGRIDLDIAHVEKSSWSVAAGPYTIAVVGTRFSVSWDGENEVMTVAMREGRVRVRGPNISGDLGLVAGQSLVSRLREAEVVVTGDTGHPAPGGAGERAAAPEAAGAPAPAETEEPRGEAREREARPAAAPWRARVAAGEFAAVIEEAESAGLERTLGNAPLADLVALADAARYLRRSDLAERALAAQRRRFPGTGDAAAASFLLGRIRDDHGDPRAAAAHYETYCREAPGGDLIEEALGRAMLAHERSGDGDRARAVAGDYAARFPGGAFAAAARRLTGAP